MKQRAEQLLVMRLFSAPTSYLHSRQFMVGFAGQRASRLLVDFRYFPFALLPCHWLCTPRVRCSPLCPPCTKLPVSRSDPDAGLSLGFLSSLVGLVLGRRLRRRSALSWFAPVCSLGVVVFWIAAAWGK